jgi:tRNA1Val (adenine37-N6)-methyltransferase
MDRLRAIHCALLNFVSEENKNKYDRIVSNPPFFQNSLLSENDRLNIARHNVSLTPQDFAKGVNHLLSDSGKLAVILPTNVAPAFCSVVEEHGLFLNTQTTIIPKPNKAAKRLISEFSRVQAQHVQRHQLTIRTANGDFTDEYKVLTHMFHPDGYLEGK